MTSSSIILYLACVFLLFIVIKMVYNAVAPFSRVLERLTMKEIIKKKQYNPHSLDNSINTNKI